MGDRDPDTFVVTLKLVALAVVALAPLSALAHHVDSGDEPTALAAALVGFAIAIVLCWFVPRLTASVLAVSSVALLGLTWFAISFGHAWSGEDWSAADALFLVLLPAAPLATGALLFVAGTVAREYGLRSSRRQVVTVILAAGVAVFAAGAAAVTLDERGLHSARSPAWSPDGRLIVYAGETLYSNVDRNFGGIYVRPVDGGQELALTRTARDDLAPAWSPDGSKIAFVRDTWTHAFLVVVDVESSTSRRLAPALGVTPWSFPRPPSWSPDGRRIVFAGAGDRSSDIFVANADGTGLRNLTRSPAAADHSPAWSPAGRLVAFVSDRDGTDGDVYVVRANGGGVRRLTKSEPENERSPTWSPDGRRIAFIRETLPANVYVMNADGSGTRGLTASGGSEVSELAWSPDGLRVAYVGTRDVANIYVVDLTGGLPQNLTHQEEAGSYSPSWSPDGRRIAFERGGEIWVMNVDGSDAHVISG